MPKTKIDTDAVDLVTIATVELPEPIAEIMVLSASSRGDVYIEFKEPRAVSSISVDGRDILFGGGLVLGKQLIITTAKVLQ